MDIQRLNEILSTYKEQVEYDKILGNQIVSISPDGQTIIASDKQDDFFILKQPAVVKLHKIILTYVDRVVVHADQEEIIFKLVARIIQQRANDYFESLGNPNLIKLDFKFKLAGQENYARYVEDSNSYELRYHMEIYEE